MFNFNETIDRRHTNCVKWDTVETSYHEKDLLPLWVADMDFSLFLMPCHKLLNRAF